MPQKKPTLGSFQAPLNGVLLGKTLYQYGRDALPWALKMAKAQLRMRNGALAQGGFQGAVVGDNR
jgi:hypothetical protein